MQVAAATSRSFLGSLAVLACVVAGAGAVVMLPWIFITVSFIGLVLGNASALAVAQASHVAGTASAVLGALQFLLGALASPLVGLGGKDDAFAMALTMVGAAILASLSLALLARHPGEA